MSKTRNKILSTSRDLFNRRGYSNVTIRMIALELNMSSGNLNYHFKKREDILSTLYFEMVKEFDQRIEELVNRDLSLKNIREDIIESMFRMVSYRFFWTDLYNILRSNKKIKAHFEEAHKNRLGGYRFLFEALIKMGVMRKFEFETEGGLLAERMIGFSNTWLYNSVLLTEEVTDDLVELQADHLLFMLYPYFLEKGKLEFRELLPRYFS